MAEISLFLPSLLLAYLVYVISAASPGPANIAIMGTAMRYGRGQGIVFASGVLAGSFTWAILASLGLTKILIHYSSALYYIKIIGGIYLLWMAMNALASSLQPSSDHAEVKEIDDNRGRFTPSTVSFFLRGLALHIMNPKGLFGWTAVVSVGLGNNSPGWVTAAIVIGCAVMGFIIFIGYAVLFSKPPMIRFYSRSKKVIERALAAVFGAAGIGLIRYDFNAGG